MSSAQKAYVERDQKLVTNEGLTSAEKISIVSREYSTRTVFWQSVHILFFVLCAMAISAAAVYIWQQQVLAGHKLKHHNQISQNTAEFDTAFQKAVTKYKSKIGQFEERIDYLGNQNSVLRKQRDQGRQDLVKIVDKKNVIIKELRTITAMYKKAELERSKALSFLNAVEEKYFAAGRGQKRKNEEQRRIEFIKEAFPEFKSNYPQ